MEVPRPLVTGVIAFAALAACEHAEDPGAAKVSPAPVSRAASPPTPPKPAPPTPPKPARPVVVAPNLPPHASGVSAVRPPPVHTVRHHAADDVAPGDPPTPPSNDPAEYSAWYAKLPRARQRQIDRFCKNNGGNYTAQCGGIGPLHIPEPPSLVMVPQPGTPTHDQWLASLTAAQARYYESYCHSDDETHAYSELCGATPLVVSFDDQPVAFAADGGRFAFRAGDAIATDWPTAATPWLALDRDGDGAITTGAELFGSATALPDGRGAVNGFEALATLDANHDGTIDREDPAFAALVLWADRDGNRRGTADELVPASSVIDSINLTVRVESRCDDRGNCERERATVRWHDVRGAHLGNVVDVYLHYR